MGRFERAPDGAACHVSSRWVVSQDIRTATPPLFFFFFFLADAHPCERRMERGEDRDDSINKISAGAATLVS